jgi:hypothetical protein
MAGADPTGNFNSDQFRAAIQQAMVMGQPNSTSQQVTFVWLEQDTYSPQGPDKDPYSWSQAPTAVTQASKTYVQVNCAVEMSVAPASGDSMGGFDPSHAVLTLLDVDYINVQGADQVLIGGHTYTIDPPGAVPFGLFDVTVFQLHCSALT